MGKMCEVCRVAGVPVDAGDQAYRFIDCDYCNPKQAVDIKVNDFICWEGYAKVKVMAVVDNYAMLKRPGCQPFVRSLSKLKEVSAKRWTK